MVVLVDEARFLFYRLELRRSSRKRELDCGCWVDGSEPYRYQVFKLPTTGPGVEQRLDCEFCSRVDNAY